MFETAAGKSRDVARRVDERVAELPVVPAFRGFTVSRSALLLFKLALASLSLIGLGVVIGSSPGGTWVTRLAIVVLAAGAIALLAQIEVRRFAAGVVLTVGLSGTAVFATTSANFTLSAVLLATFFLAAAALTSDLAHLTSAPIDDVAERANEASLEVLAANELARARRHERPLSVVSLTVAPAPGSGTLAQRHALADVARVLADRLRQNDIVGYVGRARLVALLPETSREEAVGLVDRLRPALGSDVAARLSVGIAGFPDEEVTWLGLKALAAEREDSLPAFDGDADADGIRLRALEDRVGRESRIAELEAELADGYERAHDFAR